MTVRRFDENSSAQWSDYSQSVSTQASTTPAQSFSQSASSHQFQGLSSAPEVIQDRSERSQPQRRPLTHALHAHPVASGGQTGLCVPGSRRQTGVTSQPAEPTVFQLLRSGAIPTRTRAEAALEGFSPSEAAVLAKLADDILDALGPIFPLGHNDLLITRKHLPQAFARTVFYGKAADIELNLDAHLGHGKTTVDAQACAKIAQTLTHEIVLHTRKEFQEYFSAKKISRTGGGLEGHSDACMPATREEYFEASYLVSRRLPSQSRPVFALAWHDEIHGLAHDPETKLSLSNTERGELQQWILARFHQLSK